MKRTFPILAAFLALFSTAAYADGGGFGIYGGYNTSLSKHATFDQFRTTYSAYNNPGVNIKEEMKPWGMGVGGVTIGAQARLKFFGANIDYASMKNSTVAEFMNGEKRHFDLEQSLICTGFSLGPAFDKFYLMGDFGLGMGGAMIKCYYEYNDGTISYGQETLLSGEYHSISIAPYYGGRMGIRLTKQFMLHLQATHFGSAFDNNRTVMDDIADAGSLSPTEYPGGLPLDYGAYVNSTSNYDYGSDNYVKADIKTWTFTIGIEVSISQKD